MQEKEGGIPFESVVKGRSPQTNSPKNSYGTRNAMKSLNGTCITFQHEICKIALLQISVVNNHEEISN